jgi:hypothetical protein
LFFNCQRAGGHAASSRVVLRGIDSASLHLLLRVADEIRADFDLLRSCRNGAFRTALFMNLEPLATIGSAPSSAG